MTMEVKKTLSCCGCALTLRCASAKVGYPDVCTCAVCGGIFIKQEDLSPGARLYLRVQPKCTLQYPSHKDRRLWIRCGCDNGKGNRYGQ